MRRKVAGAAVLLVGLIAAGCAPEEKEVKAPPQPEKPPEVYKVKLETTKGEFEVEVTRAWAPRGADQFFELVQNRFYDGVRFHRVVRGFVAQFGINGDPAVQKLWGEMRIRDDEVKQSNKKGFVSFAKLGPNSRTTQVFINLRDNTSLDKDGFAPFGRVTSGMDVAERLWNSYGEVAPRGSGPDPVKIMQEGNKYLDSRFPRLDSIVQARVVRDSVQ